MYCPNHLFSSEFLSLGLVTSILLCTPQLPDAKCLDRLKQQSLLLHPTFRNPRVSIDYPVSIRFLLAAVVLGSTVVVVVVMIVDFCRRTESSAFLWIQSVGFRFRLARSDLEARLPSSVPSFLFYARDLNNP